MVLSVSKQSVHSDKLEAHAQWAQQAISRMLAVPGLAELRAYRTAADTTQIVVTLEFADLAAVTRTARANSPWWLRNEN